MSKLLHCKDMYLLAIDSFESVKCELLCKILSNHPSLSCFTSDVIVTKYLAPDSLYIFWAKARVANEKLYSNEELLIWFENQYKGGYFSFETYHKILSLISVGHNSPEMQQFAHINGAYSVYQLYYYYTKLLEPVKRINVLKDFNQQKQKQLEKMTTTI